MQAISASVAGALLFTALAWHSAFFMPSSWVPVTTLEVHPISRLSAPACPGLGPPAILLHVGEDLYVVGEEGLPPLSIADAPAMRERLRVLKNAAPSRGHVILHVADGAPHGRLVEAIDAALAAGLPDIDLLAGPDVIPFELARWSRPAEDEDDEDLGCCG